MPLDGIWLRAPYLHNGSMPTLRDLLEPRRTAARRRSIAVTMCTTGQKAGSSRTSPEEKGKRYFFYDTEPSRQRQRRTPLWNATSGHGQGRNCRVYEEALKARSR